VYSQFNLVHVTKKKKIVNKKLKQANASDQV